MCKGAGCKVACTCAIRYGARLTPRKPSTSSVHARASLNQTPQQEHGRWGRHLRGSERFPGEFQVPATSCDYLKVPGQASVKHCCLTRASYFPNPRHLQFQDQEAIRSSYQLHAYYIIQCLQLDARVPTHDLVLVPIRKRKGGLGTLFGSTALRLLHFTWSPMRSQAPASLRKHLLVSMHLFVPWYCSVFPPSFDEAHLAHLWPTTRLNKIEVLITRTKRSSSIACSAGCIIAETNG